MKFSLDKQDNTKHHSPLPFPEFIIPIGTQLSDFFIDGPQVISELMISKRTLMNWRAKGIISYTKNFGKIYYFKQEIAKILIEGREVKNRNEK